MKKCSKCNREFDDNSFYCPDCGEPLVFQAVNIIRKNKTSDSFSEKSSNSTLEALRKYTKKTTEGLDNSDNAFVRWLPSISSVIGLVIAWYISIKIGIVLSLFGIIFGSGTKNNLNKIISLAVGTFCLTICVIFLIL